MRSVRERVGDNPIDHAKYIITCMIEPDQLKSSFIDDMYEEGFTDLEVTAAISKVREMLTPFKLDDRIMNDNARQRVGDNPTKHAEFVMKSMAENYLGDIRDDLTDENFTDQEIEEAIDRAQNEIYKAIEHMNAKAKELL
jgi:hypothetical protein